MVESVAPADSLAAGKTRGDRLVARHDDSCRRRHARLMSAIPERKIRSEFSPSFGSRNEGVTACGDLRFDSLHVPQG